SFQALRTCLTSGSRKKPGARGMRPWIGYGNTCRRRDDPWRAIRWNRRIVFALPFLFGLGVLLGLWLFPALKLTELWKRVGTPIVLAGCLLFFWPAPCPRCRRPFLMWSFGN